MRLLNDRPRRWRSIHAKVCLAAIVIAVLGAACTSLLAIKDPTLDDAGGGPSEAGAIDAAVDSAIDSAIDGPPLPRVCTTGACCDANGQFEPATKVCATTSDFQCAGASSCGGQPQQRVNQQFCSGSSESCDGTMMMGTFTNLGLACGADQQCVPQAGAAPQCTTCQFGCDASASACKAAPKVFVFVTDGLFKGDFGATNGGRVTADAKCQDKFNLAAFPKNGCALANVHAVIQVDDTLDTLARMAARFSIPTTAEVFRSVDPTTRVSSSWNSFVDPNAILLAPVTTDASLATFWSGRGLSQNHQCTNWTSQASVGDSGDATTVNKWTSQASTPCANLIPHLMCMCF